MLELEGVNVITLLYEDFLFFFNNVNVYIWKENQGMLNIVIICMINFICHEKFIIDYEI